jgi:putative transposase
MADGRKETEENESASMIKTNQHVLKTTYNQRGLFKRWIGAVRWTYNKCVEIINKRRKDGEKCTLAKKFYRDLFLNKSSQVVKDNPWLTDIPYDIRDGAVADITRSLSSNIKKMNKGTLKSFKHKFRAKKDKVQSIEILSKHYKYCEKTNTYYIHRDTWTKNECESLIASSTRLALPKKLECDSRLVFERASNRYILAESVHFAIFDENRVPSGDNQAAFAPIIALDPGVRTFQTGYDPRGYIIEVGKNDIGRIIRLCKHQDRLISEAYASPCRRFRYLIRRRVLPRMRAKIHNLVSDTHRKLASWLCANYKYVIIPDYRISKMVVKGHRKISRRTVRSMLTWSNYRFKQALLHKAKETSTIVHICTEEYTSKTCTRCGTIKYNLGGSKVLKCNTCKLEIDRDFNGCRNIFMKTLSECF